MQKKSASVGKAINGSAGKHKAGTAGKPAITLSKERIDELLAQARELAWAGKPALAIDVATQALTANKIDARRQVDLLETRAKSLLYLLRWDAAASDAAGIAKLARVAKKPAFKARALILQAQVEARQGRLESARDMLDAALRIARRNRLKALEAESLHWMARLRLHTGEEAVRSQKQAAAIYASLKDLTGQGRTVATLAGAYRDMAENDEARRLGEEALEIAARSGDTLTRRAALSILSIVAADLSVGLTYQWQAYQAAQSTGDLMLVAIHTSNLGFQYFGLGLYSRALRFYHRGLEIIPDQYPLSNLAGAEMELGDLDAARRHLAEAEPYVWDENIRAFVDEVWGRIALLEGNAKLAARHFRKAIRTAHHAGLGREIGGLSLLGQAHLAQGDPALALKATTRAVKRHQALGLPVIDDHPPQNIWWQHAQVLRANKKATEARQALQMAYDLLLRGVGNLHDAGLRRNYLNKVAANREILAAWLKDGAKRRLSEERLYAHLAVELSLREPFERLADTGLRLNALRDVEEIQAFLVEEATELTGGERVMLVLEKDGSREIAGSLLPRGEDAAKLLRSIAHHLDQARRTRTVLLIEGPAPTRGRGKQLGIMVAPLIAQGNLLGYFYVDMDGIYGRFDEGDRDILGMLANQGAVALDNARWAQGLEQKVADRTADLNARVDELAILNSAPSDPYLPRTSWTTRM